MNETFLTPDKIEPGMNLLLYTGRDSHMRVWARRVFTTQLGVFLYAEIDRLYHAGGSVTVLLTDAKGVVHTPVSNKSIGRTGLGRREAA